MENKNRIAWLDAARGLGIAMVYLGHFGQEAGMSYDFVFQFHVPLFFFLAGCTGTLHRRPPKEAFRRAAERLLIPYLFFGVIYLAALVIVQDSTEGMGGQLRIFLTGATRNQFAAGSLWFLTCLWVMETVNIAVSRLNPWLRVAVAAGLYALAVKALPANPMFTPQWPMNVDSAMGYFLYYTLGAVLFRGVEALFRAESVRGKAALHGAGALSLAYAAFVMLTHARDHVRWYLNVPGYDLAGTVLHTSILIFAALYAARWLQGCRPLRETGQDTLYLCGCEDLLRMTVPMALRTFGLGITIVNPFSAMVYAAALIALARRTAVPLEKKILERVMKR
ncbi:MAG: acyltransferase family protein [Clostridia bacterium]|nr:acyltransferase family protein [Clostridia bacterium]